MSSAAPSCHSPGAGTIALAFVTVLSGQFGLARVGLDVPVLGDDVRPLLFACLGVMVAADHHRRGRTMPAREPRPDPALAVLVLFAYQILSSLWAPERAQVGDRVADIVYLALLVLVYATFARWDLERTVHVSAICSYAAGLVYVAVAAAGFGHDASGRWAALGGGPNVFVRVMALGVLAGLYLHLRGHRTRWLLGVPLLAVGMFMSGSRGGLVAAALTFLAILAVAIRRMPLRLVVRGALALVPVSFVVWHVAGPTVSAFFHERYTVESLQDRYAAGRDVIFSDGWSLFLAHPVVGTGLDGFYGSVGYLTDIPYAHDLPLSVAAEGGLVGLVLFVGAIVVCARAAAAGIARPAVQLCLAVAGFIAVASLFSGGYYDARQMWIYLVMAATAGVRQPTLTAVRQRYRPRSSPALAARTPQTGRPRETPTPARSASGRRPPPPR